ncbi:ribonuclease P protein component 3 [Candidatus Aenigmatarchaeota archaeon]
MAFYDLHVHTNFSIGEDSIEEMVEMAKRLGLGGLGIVRYWPYQEEVPERDDFDLVNSVMIKAATPEELNKMIDKARKKAEVIMVHGGDYDVNRAACENSMVDIVCHPELNRRDSGLDHICVKAASDNNVAIEVNFREILESYKTFRTRILMLMRKNVQLCKKYGANVVTTSSPIRRWGLRSGRELASISHLLGLDLPKSISSTSTIPENIVKRNREKLANKRWEGVKVVED